MSCALGRAAERSHCATCQPSERPAKRREMAAIISAAVSVFMSGTLTVGTAPRRFAEPSVHPTNVVVGNDTLLRSIRERLLDESEPLAGLLRKCLMLGAETGSDSLRNWARSELNGYGDGAEVPSYRKLHGVPISMNSMSGRTWATGQIIDRHQLPKDAWEYVPEEFPFRQP